MIPGGLGIIGAFDPVMHRFRNGELDFSEMQVYTENDLIH